MRAIGIVESQSIFLATFVKFLFFFLFRLLCGEYVGSSAIQIVFFFFTVNVDIHHSMWPTKVAASARCIFLHSYFFVFVFFLYS